MKGSVENLYNRLQKVINKNAISNFEDIEEKSGMTQMRNLFSNDDS